jgi:transposase
VIADKGYDAQSVLDHVTLMGAEAVIPPKRNRKEQQDFDKEFYKERNFTKSGTWLNVFSTRSSSCGGCFRGLISWVGIIWCLFSSLR